MLVAPICVGNPQSDCNYKFKMARLITSRKILLTESLSKKPNFTTAVREFWIRPMCENRAGFGEYPHLMPRLRGEYHRLMPRLRGEYHHLMPRLKGDEQSKYEYQFQFQTVILNKREDDFFLL